MRLTDTLQSVAGLAFLATTFLPTTVQSRHAFEKGHRHSPFHHHHRRQIRVEKPITESTVNDTLISGPLEKRSDQCAFPYGPSMVAVTPDDSNAGWAMSPDQPCLPGGWCPYACAPGYLMDQWDPAATSYIYPESMYGGLYCGEDGTISKPYPDRDYCVPGVGTMGARNEMSSSVAICQTVLPGNEAMLIPTEASAGTVTGLAVPSTSYWAATAAHYYINPAGVSTAEGCVWGTNANPWGNWAPFVAGANMDADGNTFTKIGWNPIYIADSAWASVLPTWAVSIECVGGGCNGTPCRCDPSLDGYNQCNTGSDGAGGAAFCVVTVPPGSSANIVIYDTASGASSSSAIVTNVNNKDLEVVPQTTSLTTASPTTSTSPTTTSTSSSSTSTTTSSTSTTSSSTTSSTTSTSTTSTSTTSTSTSSSSSSSSSSSFSIMTPTSYFTTLATSYGVDSLETSLPTFNNATSTSKSSTTAVAPTVFQNFLNIQASPSAVAVISDTSSDDKKSGAPDLLTASPLLAFIGAVVVLWRL